MNRVTTLCVLCRLALLDLLVLGKQCFLSASRHSSEVREGQGPSQSRLQVNEWEDTSGSSKTNILVQWCTGCVVLSMDNYNDASRIIDQNFDGVPLEVYVFLCSWSH